MEFSTFENILAFLNIINNYLLSNVFNTIYKLFFFSIPFHTFYCIIPFFLICYPFKNFFFLVYCKSFSFRIIMEIDNYDNPMDRPEMLLNFEVKYSLCFGQILIQFGESAFRLTLNTNHFLQLLRKH